MWKTGLTSISFRSLSCPEIIELAARAQLDGIEWGSDGHVLPGRATEAAEVAARTREAGLEVLSVGSYYYAGENSADDGLRVLELCEAMGTDTLRVWAGRTGSLPAEGEIRARVVRALQLLCEQARSRGITVCTEYHRDTLTDNAASALRLVHEVGQDNFRTYWQPVVYDSAEANARALGAVLPHAETLHVFAWSLDAARQIVRHPLADASSDWSLYLGTARRFDTAHPGHDRAFLLEFVRNDDPAQALRDAQTLNRWVRG